MPAAASPTSFVAINVLTVPADRRDVLEQRFGARAGQVDQMEGFESFDLLRPVDGQDRYLVVTRWASKEDFERWLSSQAFGQGHAQPGAQGPAATGSELWTFEVATSASAAARG